MPVSTKPGTIRDALGPLKFLGDALFGGGLEWDRVEELLTVGTGASTTATIALPVGTIASCVAWFIKATIPGITNIDIGITGTATHWVTNSTKKDADEYDISKLTVETTPIASATTLLVTPDTNPSAATGQILLECYFLKLNYLDTATKP